jgi:hypothetical protein
VGKEGREKILSRSPARGDVRPELRYVFSQEIPDAAPAGAGRLSFLPLPTASPWERKGVKKFSQEARQGATSGPSYGTYLARKFPTPPLPGLEGFPSCHYPRLRRGLYDAARFAGFEVATGNWQLTTDD